MKRLVARVRCIAAILAVAGLAGQPLAAAPPPSSSPLGTIVYADRALVGGSAASLGSTLFGGDRISTDRQGSLQVRAGAARLKLSGASSAILLQEANSIAAILTAGGATVSTASENAFVLHAFEAIIKPSSNEPTVGQVMILGRNEIFVKSTQGVLVCSVAGEDRLIREGEAFRVVLDSPADASAAAAAAGGGNPHPPISTGKNHAVYLVAAGVAVVTVFALHEALESPDRP